MIERRTIQRTVELPGTGLFTGKPAVVRLHPRPGGGGITLRRGDAGLPEAQRSPIPANVAHVQQLPGLPGRNTVVGLSPQGPHVITTEHVLSALAGMGITDCDIEITGPEVPMFDGSAAIFTALVLQAGHEVLPGHVDPLRIREVVRVEGQGGAWIEARPREIAGCSYAYNLDYTGMKGAESFAPQFAKWEGDSLRYIVDVAPARTFCLVPEAMALRQAGLFQHVGPSDMLVLDPSGAPVENTLRFADEPARHKLLDLIGDLALVGRPIQADITASKAGHALNHEMARKLLAAAIP